MPVVLPFRPLASLLVLCLLTGAASAGTGGGPYFLLRPRIEAADVVVVGMVRSVVEVKELYRPDTRVAVLELSGLWKGGNADKYPETLEVRDWYGPEPEPRRRTPWVYFLSRTAGTDGPVCTFQAATDLSSLSPGRRELFEARVQEFVEIEALRNDDVRLRTTVRWLMDQVRDPTSREGATFDLQRPLFHKRLNEEQVAVLQELYCSLEQFDMTAGHLTDILAAVTVDRDQFVRCAFGLLEGEVDRATWTEAGLVSVIEANVPCEEVAGLVSEYRATQPVIRMRGIEDTPERQAMRRDVLLRLCEAARHWLDAPPEGPPLEEDAVGHAAAPAGE